MTLGLGLGPKLEMKEGEDKVMEKVPPSSIKYTTVRWVSWAKAELWLLLPLDDVGMSGREGKGTPIQELLWGF